MHLKSKGRWAGDIAFIYARFCPEMDREAVRAMGQTDAPPFMECADSHWASFRDGPRTQQTWATTRSLMTVTKLYQTTKTIDATGSVARGLGWFLRLRLGRHVHRRRHADDVTRDAASRHTTTNYRLASLYYVLN